jgi:uncharacterized phosphosugar-binding protein
LIPASVADAGAAYEQGELHDIVSPAIDTGIPAGDAVVDIPGFPYKVAGISTLVNVYVLNVLVCGVVEKLVRAGIDPPVWVSANAPGGDAWNKRLLERYLGRIRHL